MKAVIFSVATGAFLSATASNAMAEMPAFIVVLKPAIPQDKISGSDKVIYTQAFSPEAIVATTTDITTTLRSPKMLTNRSKSVTVPAGTLFVKAIFKGQIAYCASWEQTDANLLQGSYFEGVCLSADDGSGHFTQATYLTPTGHVDGPKSPYEIFDGRDTPETETVNVGYNAVPNDDRFQSQLQLREVAVHSDELLISTEIRYPVMLSKNPNKFSPDTIIWTKPVSDRTLTSTAWPTPFKLNGGSGKIDITSDISVAVTYSEDKSMSLSWDHTLTPGTYLLQLQGITKKNDSIYAPMDIFVFKLQATHNTDVLKAGH